MSGGRGRWWPPLPHKGSGGGGGGDPPYPEITGAAFACSLEIDDFPSYKPPFMVGIFHGYVSHDQMLVAGHSIFQICQPVRGADPVMHQAPMLEMSLAAERLDTWILGIPGGSECETLQLWQGLGVFFPWWVFRISSHQQSHEISRIPSGFRTLFQP